MKLFDKRKQPSKLLGINVLSESTKSVDGKQVKAVIIRRSTFQRLALAFRNEKRERELKKEVLELKDQIEFLKSSYEQQLSAKERTIELLENALKVLKKKEDDARTRGHKAGVKSPHGKLMDCVSDVWQKGLPGGIPGLGKRS
jgi:hypothetical protein